MNLQRPRSVLGKGSRHLGDIVFWQLADARVDRATLESLWRDVGLDAALLPEDEKTTQRYVMVTSADKRNAIERAFGQQVGGTLPAKAEDPQILVEER